MFPIGAHIEILDVAQGHTMGDSQHLQKQCWRLGRSQPSCPAWRLQASQGAQGMLWQTASWDPHSCISFLIEAISHFTVLCGAEFLWLWLKPPQRVLLDKAFVLQQIQMLVKSNSFQIMNWKCRYTGGAPLGVSASYIHWASQVVLAVKNLPASPGDVRDAGSILGSGRSPGGGHGNPLQYSCLENPVDRGAWRATVYRVSKSRTHDWSNLAATYIH